MSVYSTQLADLVAPAGVFTASPAIPAGKIAVVKDIDVVNIGAAASNIAVFRTSTVRVFFAVVLLASADSAHWHGRLVLQPGETLGFFGSTQNFDCFAAGFLLDP